MEECWPASELDGHGQSEYCDSSEFVGVEKRQFRKNDKNPQQQTNAYGQNSILARRVLLANRQDPQVIEHYLTTEGPTVQEGEF